MADIHVNFHTINQNLNRFLLRSRNVYQRLNRPGWLSALIFLGAIHLMSGCKNQLAEHSMFTVLDTKTTGLAFTNRLTPTPAFNLFSYMYYYNGAGVGAGDFNNDGLTDLFFSANQRSNTLYLNKGSMHFEDVSAVAGIPADSAWSTGVSVIDINNDGLLDIYVCRVSNFNLLKGKNQLLVCKEIDAKGIPHYQEEAALYGIDFSGYSSQAAFLDYDSDGDLDMFLLNHAANHDGNYAPREYFNNTFDSLAGQRLYRNDEVKNQLGKPQVKFTNVTATTGISGSKLGYGLGVAVADINLDGWPDIYVGNDFHENDYLYINQKNGTFSDESKNSIRHTSLFSMGVDIADVNNDAFPDIISMDMLPYDPYMIRRSPAEDDYTIFQQKLAYGYSIQYARNNLQYNRGNGRFSEVGQYAGVHATDWSWASLWMDFNNDGQKDLFVSNGIPKRLNDIDYINFISGTEIQQKLKENTIGNKELALINKFPEIKIPNQFFLNEGNFKFKNLTDSIYKNPPTFSNGAVYADLDNDGDLDIVVNNIDEPVMLYQNNTNNNIQKTAFADLQLTGFPKNGFAIGARVVVFSKGAISTYEQQTVHGFQSSMLLPIHIGLQNVQADSVLLIWPDNSCQSIRIKRGVLNKFSYQKGLPNFDYSMLRNHLNGHSQKTVEDITAASGLLFRHTENPFNEFDREPLMPHMLSTEGPVLAVADINHDGLEDVFIGASKSNHNAVFLQTAGGRFQQLPQPELLKDSMWENIDAKWVDVNGDQHPDLVIASGGNEFYGEDLHLSPLLYINDGKGHLSKKADAFPDIFVTQSKVVSTDINGDGFVDLFIAGRAMPWQYGIAPRSFLLQNDGTGKFTDITATKAKELLTPGMVTDAVWVDLNADRKQDLVLCYEWGGIDAFVSDGTSFRKKTITRRKGWWQFALPADVDGDGDPDLVAGNFGLNSRIKASEAEPVSLYINDFDDNGKTEQILTYFLSGKEIPFSTKNLLEKQMPYLKKKFLYAADFANAALPDLFGQQKLTGSTRLTADYFSNAILLNNGQMNFSLTELPFNAQLSTYRSAAMIPPVMGTQAAILLLGNFYSNSVEIGRQDADYGTLITYKGAGKFSSATLPGKPVSGEVRKVQPIQIGDKTAYIIVKNNEAVQVVRIQ